MSDTARDRISRLYRFLHDYAELRSPIKRHIDEQPWHYHLKDLPDHPSVVSSGQVGGDYALRVQRPKTTYPPNLPKNLEEWIERGWDNPFQTPKVRPSLDKITQEAVVTIQFEDNPARTEAWQNWQRAWQTWAEAERPARDASRLYEQMFELRGRLEREGERLELLLGDGVISWRSPEGDIHHPILLQRVQLEFNPSVPEFRIVESDQGVEFYSAVLRSAPGLEAETVARIRQTLAEGDYHPLDEADTSGFLRYVVQQLSSKGTYQDKIDKQPVSDYPVMGRDRVLFLRERNQGYAKAVEAILENLPKADLPAPLLRIVGIENKPEPETETSTRMPLPGEEPEDILFSKPWNQEQLQIAERLERHSGVVVQGPPGTGKTHTIANLIGHLLAQGKSVLVTAHTTKALRVVREQVVEELRPLCVGVLDNDQESRKQLEDSVEKIVERLSGSNVKLLEAEAAKLTAERRELLSSIHGTQQELLEARSYEYRDIVVAGKGYNPSEAARKVRAEADLHDWIPGVVGPGEPLPLSREELAALYNTNTLISPEAEAELQLELPDPADLLTPQAFSKLLTDLEKPGSVPIRPRDDLWESTSESAVTPKLEDTAQDFAQAVLPVTQEESWILEAILAGQQGGVHRESWDKLLAEIEQTLDLAARAQEKIIQHDPKLSSQIPVEEQQQIAGEIAAHLSSGGNLGFFALLNKGSWKNLIRGTGVSSGEPQRPEHFGAIEMLARLQIARRALVKRWDYLISNRNGPKLSGKVEPERFASQYTVTIGDYLGFSKVLETYEQTLKQSGFRWEKFLAEEPANPSPHGELLRLAGAVSSRLSSIVKAKIAQVQRAQAKREMTKLAETLAVISAQSRLAQLLSKAVAELDSGTYTEAFNALVEVIGLRPTLERRGDLLIRLNKAAPDWVRAIDRRTGKHKTRELPGDPEAAWLYKQLSGELERRAQTSPQVLQDRLTKLTKTLHQTTARLIEKRTWMHQLKRTTLTQQQALFGWLNTVKKMGKTGKGKRVPKLRLEAARLMKECRTAVPVWIMPLSRAVEQFDPRFARFDVVIIDEASQTDVMGLLPFAIAEEVVVVGDHEQVSPDAVGEEINRTEQLIGEHLRGIPNSHLYDGKTSIYDIARQAFGGMISLLEHFRCVPEIIQFSNALCYQGRIKPLRESSGILLKPHVIAHRVQGVRNESGKVNPREAEEIAALIAAATEMREYDGKTFGVITLLGEEQAIAIDRSLRRRLSEDVYTSRRILCGTAPQFQGDERDVVFLSLVDSPREGPLPLLERDNFKQRYNVAASRARDQLWVVYSLNPQTDLKPGDLRRRLIEYALDPGTATQTLEAGAAQTESEFERQVFERLHLAGYKVTPQWKVGSYRIDLVVEGGGKRLAVECDGDRYHSLDHLTDDMARQAMLERVGWRFARIRGSEFFRNPEAAMKPVFDWLERSGIQPEASSGPYPLPENDELRERVIRRAAELLAENFAEDTPYPLPDGWRPSRTV